MQSNKINLLRRYVVNRILLPGRRYGKLTVNEDSLDAVCDCGCECYVRPKMVYNGMGLSCGCESIVGKPLVYAVSACGYVKIGYSTNFCYRIEAIQNATPDDVKVLCLLTGATKRKEKMIHKSLKRFSTHLEWFVECDALLQAIFNSDDADDLLANADSIANASFD